METAEIYKAASPNILESFHQVLNSILNKEEMPEDFRDALIVAIYKNKDSKADYGNYRGISLCFQLLARSSFTLF